MTVLPLRTEALALVAAHPEALRDDYADRLLAMTPAELAFHIELRAVSARQFDRDYAPTYREAEDPIGPPCSKPRRPADRRDHDDLAPGLDPRLALNEVDHPRAPVPDVDWRAAG